MRTLEQSAQGARGEESWFGGDRVAVLGHFQARQSPNSPRPRLHPLAEDEIKVKSEAQERSLRAHEGIPALSNSKSGHS